MRAVFEPEGRIIPYDVAARTPGASRPRLLAVASLLGLGALLFLLLVVPGSLDGLDARSMYEVAQSMVTHGDVTTLSKATGVPGLDGHLYSKYGPGQSVATLPLYLAGRALMGLVPPHFAPELPIMISSLLPAIVTALTVELLFLTAVELGASALGALALSVVYVLATPAIVYAAQWFSEPLTALALLAAVYALVRDRRAPSPWRPLLAGIALAFAVATRIDAVLFVPPLFVYLAWPRDGRGARLFSFLVPLGIAAAGLVAYNLARFGSPFETGYGIADKLDAFARRDAHPPHTIVSFATGVYGLLLSPGKGLLEYAPPMLLAPFGVALLWARRRAEMLLLLSLFVLYLAAHANVLIRWVGGWSWGPRFLIPVLPIALLLLAPLLGPRESHKRLVRAALVVLALLGVAVQIPALAVHEPHAYLYTIELPYMEKYCHSYHPATGWCDHSIPVWNHIEADYSFKPGDSLIVGAWRMLGRPGTWTLPGDLVPPGHVAVRPAHVPSQPSDVSPATIAAKNVTTAPHTWWWLLYLQGVPARALWIICALLLGGALACLGVALRLASRVAAVPRLAAARVDVKV